MLDFTDAQIKWIQLVISFVGGGTIGAFLKQYFDHRRNRQQPIAYEITLQSVYNATDNKLLGSEIILQGTDGQHKFSNLYSGSIVINNTGLQDFDEFKFGLTCTDDIRFVQLRPITEDRHHVSSFNQEPDLGNQLSLFDVTLKPFNRGNSYQIDMLFTTDKTEVTPEDILVSTSHSVKLISITPIRNTAIVSSIVDTVLPVSNLIFPLNLLLVPVKLVLDWSRDKRNLR